MGCIPSKLLKTLIATRRYNGKIELIKEKNVDIAKIIAKMRPFKKAHSNSPFYKFLVRSVLDSVFHPILTDVKDLLM
jgi:hypothetical protein